MKFIKNIKNLYLYLYFFSISIFLMFSLFSNNENINKINYGIDIKGGFYLNFTILEKDLINKELENLAISIKYISKTNKLLEYKINNDNLILFFNDKNIGNETKELLDKESNTFPYTINNNTINIKFNKNKLNDLTLLKRDRIINIINLRLNKFGMKESRIYKKNIKDIVIEIPYNDTVSLERIKNIISQNGDLSLYLVNEKEMEELNFKYNLGGISKLKENLTNQSLLNEVTDYLKNKQLKYFNFKDTSNIVLITEKFPLLRTDDIKGAQIVYNNNKPNISFEISDKGKELFYKYSEENIGKRIAIIFNKEIYSAPQIQNSIYSNNLTISGDFKIEEAVDIVNVLNNGELPVKLELKEEKVINPSLGLETVNKMLLAMLLSFILIFSFMKYRYNKIGWISNFILIFVFVNILFVFALFEATLTISGLIGFILTIGISLDTNIIINETIQRKIKLNTNKKIVVIFEEAYIEAKNTILDSNITTLISAIVLFSFSNNVIKGFALSIFIGTIISLIFTLYLTKKLVLNYKDKLNNNFFGIKE